MKVTDLDTPSAIIDIEKMKMNIERMQTRMNSLGVSFRPHVKTSKCLSVVKAQMEAGAKGITVSTLKEADYFFENGITDITYAVGISERKLAQASAFIKKGCDLKIITDSPLAAQSIVAYANKCNVPFKVLIEIDTDGHRSGLKPEQAELIDTALILNKGGVTVEGVLTHAGSSYELDTLVELEKMAEQERSGCVNAAERIRKAGIECAVVSVGSTPTALTAVNLDGVTEVRAGVYVFFDLVMHNIGVCTVDEIALSVLTTVTGHQREKGWAIVDAGWMAMSRDQGTMKQKRGFGYGQVCDINGQPVPYILSGANQEHGIVSAVTRSNEDISEVFPVGTLLRILPNHACATGAQFPEYISVERDGQTKVWPRIYGW